MFERAGDLAERRKDDAGRKSLVSSFLYPTSTYPDVGLPLEQVAGEAVPLRVRRDRPADLGHLRRGMAGAVELTRRERLHRIFSSSFSSVAYSAFMT
jgi:hypothetical protein